MPVRKAFIPIDDVIKSAMIDCGETSPVMYQKFMSWIIRGVNEMGYDVFRKFKRTFLAVDPDTKSARLPDDFVQYTQIGLQTQNNEFVPLVYNPSIIINPTIPNCDEHCECGTCDNELCYDIGHSQAVTTTSEVVINGVTYEKTVTVCTSEDGKVIKRTCQPTLVIEEAEGTTLLLDSSNPDLFVDVLGVSMIDISTNGEKASDTDWINSVAELDFLYYKFPDGSTSQWNHFYGDGYAIDPDEVTERGYNINTLLDGVGAVVYGYSFFEDFVGVVQAIETIVAGDRGIVIVLNLAAPLIQVRGENPVDPNNINFTPIFDEIDAIAAYPNIGDIRRWQLCLEMGIEDTSDIVHSAADYVSVAQPIIDYITNNYAGQISVDAYNADDTATLYPEWNAAVLQLEGVDSIRQYFQFQGNLDTYEQNRARIRDYADQVAAFKVQFPATEMGLVVEQCAIKSGNPLRLKVGEGLIYCEMFIEVINENLVDGRVPDFTFFSISRLVAGNGNTYAAFDFVKLFRDVFRNNGKIVHEWETSDQRVNNLVIMPVWLADFPERSKVYIVNPTDEAIPINSVVLDDNQKAFSIQSYYGDPYASEDNFFEETDVTETTLPPHSASVITTGETSGDAPTPPGEGTVETYCYEEVICEPEVLECGCIAPTDTEIEVICNCCQFERALTERWRKRKDFGQTFKQPLGYFGEFNIDVNEGIIQFNNEYQYDAVYLEYYSANEVDSKDYLIPVQAEEALAAYIMYKYKFNKNGVSLGERLLLQRQFYNEKRKLKQRLNPLRLDELFQAVRTFQRP